MGQGVILGSWGGCHAATAFPNRRARKCGRWKRRERDIISPKLGLESGIKGLAPPGSCEKPHGRAGSSRQPPCGGSQKHGGMIVTA